MEKSKYILAGVAALLLALLAVGVFMYQRSTDVEIVVDEMTDEVNKADEDETEALDPEEEVTAQTETYTNNSLGFSIDIPEGYVVNESGDQSIIVASAPSGSNEGFPEFTLNVFEGDVDNLFNVFQYDEEESGVSEEDLQARVDSVSTISAGRVSGKTYQTIVTVSPTDDATTLCPVSLLENNGTVYHFATWECLGSTIIDDVISSFKSVSN